jgi:RNA polymerase sigma-70 factor, ECF subfamily
MAADHDNADHERFAGWVREHGGAVRGYLRARVSGQDLADDLTQEVFHRAWAARRRYQEQGNARAYLLRIADRLARDHYRAKKPVNLDDAGWRRMEPSSIAGDPAAAAALSEAAARLTEVLAELSPLQQRVLLLRYYGQLSFAEIADIIECPLNTALSHCRRGLEALRKLLVEKEP